MHFSPRLTSRLKRLSGALIFASSAHVAWVSPAYSYMTPMLPTDRREVIAISDMQACGDDGIGLLMLALDKRISLLAAIGTSGNVWANDATSNIARLLQSLKSSTQAYVGLPIQHHAERISRYRQVKALQPHFVTYPGALSQLGPHLERTPTGHLIAKESGIDYLTGTLLSRARPVTLCVLGPGTILWEALQREPRLTRIIENVFMMGGAIHIRGNATEFAEFNFWFDPVAANGLLHSDIPITLIPLDATDPVSYESNVLHGGDPNSLAYHYLQECFKQRHLRTRASLRMWDEVVAAATLTESVISESRAADAEVETSVGLHYGALRLSVTVWIVVQSCG